VGTAAVSTASRTPVGINHTDASRSSANYSSYTAAGYYTSSVVAAINATSTNPNASNARTPVTSNTTAAITATLSTTTFPGAT